MNLREIAAGLDTQEKCLDYIERHRWPEGVRCVTCGSERVYRVKSSSKKQSVRRLFECSEPTCQQQFTATSGTIMHDTHLPLQTWLMATALIMNAKKGISAKQLQRDLGLGSYKTAWHLAHRIRSAMHSNLSLPMGGILEVDETYVGGKKIGMGVYKGKHSKAAVLGVVKRGGELRLKSVGKSTVDSKDAQQFISENVSRSAQMVCTDDSSIYPVCEKLIDLGARHQSVNHSAKEFVRFKHIHTNTIENAFSLLKRGIIGNFHHVSQKHLHRYLDEFEYRFNQRKNPAAYSAAIKRGVQGRPLPLKVLTLP